MPYLILFVLTISMLGCGGPPPDTPSSPLPAAPAPPPPIDTTPRITGIGGIFFETDNPEDLQRWYAQQLGLTTDQFGAVFEFRNANRPEKVNYLRWSLFPEEMDYFAPSERDFMINYRVQNIEGLVRNLRAAGAEILDTIAVYDYGKFVHLLDPQGHKIELWEPVDSVLTAMGGPTNK